MPFFDRKDDFMFIRWAREIKQRDHYTCTICGRRGVELNAHHMNAWASYPDERYDLENGTTLCIEHHEWFHSIYGKGNNTKEEFEEYRQIIEAIQVDAKYEVELAEAVKRATSYIDVQDKVNSIISEIENDGYV